MTAGQRNCFIAIEEHVRNYSFPDAVVAIMELAQSMRPADRLEIISEFKKRFCISCGFADPGCQCGNDE